MCRANGGACVSTGQSGELGPASLDIRDHLIHDDLADDLAGDGRADRPVATGPERLGNAQSAQNFGGFGPCGADRGL